MSSPIESPSSPRQVPLTHSALIRKRKKGTLTDVERAELRVLDAASAARHRKKTRQADPEPVQAPPIPEKPVPATVWAESPEEMAAREQRLAEWRAETLRNTAKGLSMTIPEVLSMFCRQGEAMGMTRTDVLKIWGYKQLPGEHPQPDPLSLFAGIDPSLPKADIDLPAVTPARITDAQLQQFYEFDRSL